MITSSANKQIKELVQYMKKSKHRKADQIFVVEGIKMFLEAPKDWILKVYVSESFLKEDIYKEKVKKIEHEIINDAVFEYVSDTKTPQGILCLMKMPSYKMQDLFSKKNGVYLVLENIQDPGNLGTMFRTGEGAGISGIIMNENTVDLFNPKTIRSTMGSIYRIPFFITSDLKNTMGELKQNGIRLYAAHLRGTLNYDKADYQSGCAFMIGNEGNGLSDETANLADTYIKIPMDGALESLNAAMAAGLLMYESARQRRV